MRRTYYLAIAGFSIKVVFSKTQWKFLQDRFIKEFNFFYHGFFVSKKPKKTDYAIEVKETLSLPIVFNNKNNLYINFFTKTDNKKIITFYQISIIQFQLILREILLELLATGRGFFLHGSATNINNTGLVFLGKNGAGKSTAMSLLHPEFTALADDTVIIKKENGRYFLYQTPFIEKNHWIRKKSGRYIINKVFFLRKAKYFKTKLVKNKNYVLDRLTKQFWSNKEYSKIQFKMFLKFVNQFDDFYFLYFSKSKKKLIKLLNYYV